MTKVNDPIILCFQHCEPKSKIFCFHLPDHCPICNVSLTGVSFHTPPFRVPFPFANPEQIPTSVIIRPTEEDFLNNYQNANDLHIGLTDSKSDVYEFDHKGVHIGTHNRKWNNCLNIPIISKANQTWNEFWDYNLKILVDMPIWKAENYSEKDNNCYSFVITFLRLLQIKSLRTSLSSKTQFCKDYIVPQTKNAAKYIALYRQVVKKGITIITTK